MQVLSSVSRPDMLRLRKTATHHHWWWVVGAAHAELAGRLVALRTPPGSTVHRVGRVTAAVQGHYARVSQLALRPQEDGTRQYEDGALHYLTLLATLDRLLCVLQAASARAAVDEVLSNAI